MHKPNISDQFLLFTFWERERVGTGWVVWATNTWAVGLARRCRHRFDPRSRSFSFSKSEQKISSLSSKINSLASHNPLPPPPHGISSAMRGSYSTNVSTSGIPAIQHWSQIKSTLFFTLILRKFINWCGGHMRLPKVDPSYIGRHRKKKKVQKSSSKTTAGRQKPWPLTVRQKNVRMRLIFVNSGLPSISFNT